MQCLILAIIILLAVFPMPRAAAQDLPYLRGEAVTHYAPVPSGRVHNILLAARRLSGAIIAPGTSFSFNAALGPYTQAGGYLPAPTILEDRYVPGYGGGVCQVSGTLYDAALAGGLRILERHPHTLAVGYLPPGFDATVAPGGIDLRFTNNTPSPVLIKAEGRGGKLIISLWGSRPLLHPARLVTKIDEIIPPPIETVPDLSLPPGTRIITAKGAPGYLVDRWLLVDGKRLPLPSDRYLARPTIMRENLAQD